jgi:hypothetical protein
MKSPLDLLTSAMKQQAFPEFLYKFRSDSDFTENIITKNELWFSDPLIFNDPYDCNTPVTQNTTINEIENWLKSLGVDPVLAKDVAARLKANPNYMKVKTAEAMHNLGVCCFSSQCDNILQWSHYADYHKGICLKFEIEKDLTFFQIPVIVTYRKLMQHYNHFVHSANIVNYLIRNKYIEWGYESEIRIVKTKDAIENNGDNRSFKYKDMALKEIIFGFKTPDTIITKYKNLCKNNNKGHVTFAKMDLGTGAHYELIKTNIP